VKTLVATAEPDRQALLLQIYVLLLRDLANRAEEHLHHDK
jgi:hypothetical protein